MNDLSFSDLGLPDSLLAAIEELGYEAPSSIQAAAIPVAMKGGDIIGLSETGSGKTAAFGLAGLSKIDLDNTSPQMLVVCPTRELAVQVCEELQRLGSKMGRLRSLAVYGGAPIDRQMRALRQGTHLIVGTPGRLIDLVKRRALDLSGVGIAVLDEADRMLDMGFIDEMESILKALPDEHQTMFFSATMNKGVNRLIQQFGEDPELIEIKREALTVDTIEQICFEARQRSRIELVSRIIDLEQPKLAIIFCNTKRAVDECTESLLSRGYSADRLHGDIAQSMRERVLRLFKEGTIEILVATDVAARGIDVDDIELVVNYDLPQDPEDYVHRIGRTGRAGRSGKAISFIHGRDAYRIKTIERYTRQTIKQSTIPTQKDVESHLADQLIGTVQEKLKTDDSKEDVINSLRPLVEEGFEWDQIAGSLMTLLREMTSRDGEEILEDSPDYVPGGTRRGRDRGRNDRPDRRDRRDNDRGGYDRGERGGKFERGDRGGKQNFKRDSGPAEAGMTKLFLSLGKKHRVGPGDIVGMLHNECNLERGSVGRINLMPNFTIVEVKNEAADQAIEGARSAKLRGQGFKIDRDRGPKD